MDDRLDVFMSAKEAKKIGLVSKINKITPSKRSELNIAAAKIAASNNIDPTFIPEKESKQVVTNKKVDKMTIEKLRAEHPEVYSAIVAEERDRVGAYLAFVEVDAKAVSEGIKSGDRMSQTMMAEMAIKMNATATLAAVEAAAAPAVEAAAIAVEDEKTEYQKTEARLMASLNLKTN